MCSFVTEPMFPVGADYPDFHWLDTKAQRGQSFF